MRRVPAGSSRGTSSVISWTNRLSGSVLDLDPGTTYEIELTLRDPDGGEAIRTVETSTRAEAVAAADARMRQGTRADLNSVMPGDVLMLADGDYGAVTSNRDGEPGKPIVYRSASGKAVFSEIGLSHRKWVYLEGVTVNGPVRMNGTESCAVRRCRIQSQYGIKAYRPGMWNACIEDNVVTGIQPWKPELESEFFRRYRQLIREELGSPVLLTLTNDHADTKSPCARLRTTLEQGDWIDEHAYWQHPGNSMTATGRVALPGSCSSSCARSK